MLPRLYYRQVNSSLEFANSDYTSDKNAFKEAVVLFQNLTTNEVLYYVSF